MNAINGISSQVQQYECACVYCVYLWVFFCVFYLICEGLAGEMEADRERDMKKSRAAGNMTVCYFIFIYLNASLFFSPDSLHTCCYSVANT